MPDDVTPADDDRAPIELVRRDRRDARGERGGAPADGGAAAAAPSSRSAPATSACSGPARSSPTPARGCRTTRSRSSSTRCAAPSSTSGLVNFVSGIPVLFLALPAGALADRVDKRKLLIVSQLVLMLQAGALAILYTGGHLSPDHGNPDAALLWIAGLGLLGGVMSALTFPAWQSLLPDLVPRRNLLNAIALNSAQFQSARLLGPLAGRGAGARRRGDGRDLLGERRQLRVRHRGAVGDPSASRLRARGRRPARRREARELVAHDHRRAALRPGEPPRRRADRQHRGHDDLRHAVHDAAPRVRR